MTSERNGNGIYKWIAAILLTACFGLLGYAAAQNNSRIDSVKADSTVALDKVNARVDANTATIAEMKGDLKVVKFQTDLILQKLDELTRKKDTASGR